jgi:hypothetical protein
MSLTKEEEILAQYRKETGGARRLFALIAANAWSDYLANSSGPRELGLLNIAQKADRENVLVPADSAGKRESSAKAAAAWAVYRRAREENRANMSHERARAWAIYRSIVGPAFAKFDVLNRPCWRHAQRELATLGSSTAA